MTAPAALSVRLRRPLDRFDLEVRFTAERRVTGIFGPSGAGKTSLLRAIVGLDRRARGTIRLGERLWLDSATGRFVPPERRDIGYVPQEGLLFPHLDVRRNLLCGARRAERNGWSPIETLRLVCRLLELDDLLGRRPATLSGGERQRVALGRAICSGPRLLVLDEPLASLDLPLRRRVLPFLRRVREELDVPMLLVSHDPREVQALCDELVALHRGRVVAQGQVRELLTDPGVFPDAGREGIENVVACRIVASHGDTSEVTLGDGQVTLVVPRAAGATGDRLLLGLPAHEILIATREPVGLSARNILPARITRVRSEGELRLLTAALDEELPELAAVVTEEACRELRLEPGRRVYLVIKTASCTLYEASARAQTASSSV